MPPKRKRPSANLIRSEGAKATDPFPPLRQGLSVPKGAYLNIKTTASEGGRSYMSRTGFVKLPTSTQFVQDLRRDIEHLRNSVWRAYQERLNIQADTASPFECFRDHFRQQGWHRVQFFWSEHEDTRQAMYDTIIRVCAEPLQSIADAYNKMKDGSEGSCGPALSDRQIFWACLSLFCLYGFQSTTILTSRDSNPHRESRPRVALEADLFKALLKLPLLVKDQALVDEVTFTLRTMLGETRGGGESVFDIMLPSHYQARPPLVDNTFSSKGDLERKRKPAGRLIDDETGAIISLSKAELGLAMVRQALDMPQMNVEQRYQQSLRLEKEQVRNRWTSLGNAMVAPFTRHIEMHEAAAQAATSAGELVTQKRRKILGTTTIIDADFVDKIRSATSALNEEQPESVTTTNVETVVKPPTLTLREIVQHSRDRMLAQLVQHVRDPGKRSTSQ